MKAVALAKYMVASKKHDLLNIAVYLTERCNSKCAICGVWRKVNPQDMGLEIFDKIINTKAHLAILGGELLLHPQIEVILQKLMVKGTSYNIETNGILADYLIELTNKYKIPEIQVSCDGVKDTYNKIRGIDNYDNVVRLVEKLSSITQLRLNYTVCPWNTREDLIKVKRLCDEYKAQLSVEIYENFEYLNTPNIKKVKYYESSDMQPFPRNLLLKLYERWVDGKLVLPCHSIKWSCSVIPSGEVYLCTHKMVSLGNLNGKSLDDIWESDKVRDIHSVYGNCNGCWSGCYKNIDVALWALKYPKYLVEAL